MEGIALGLIQAGAYLTVIVILYAALSFMTKGWLGQYIKVKLSRGKFTLIKCHDVTDTYYKAGTINSKRVLTVRDKNKSVHSFANMDSSFVQRELGVNLIEVSLETGTTIKKDFSSTSGHDLTVTDEMVNRAIVLPRLSDNLEKVDRIILYIILLGIGVLIFLIITQPDRIVEKLGTKILSACSGGGNI